MIYSNKKGYPYSDKKGGYMTDKEFDELITKLLFAAINAEIEELEKDIENTEGLSPDKYNALMEYAKSKLDDKNQ